MSRSWYHDQHEVRVTGAPLWVQLLDRFPDDDPFGEPYDDFTSAHGPETAARVALPVPSPHRSDDAPLLHASSERGDLPA